MRTLSAFIAFAATLAVATPATFTPPPFEIDVIDVIERVDPSQLEFLKVHDEPFVPPANNKTFMILADDFVLDDDIKVPVVARATNKGVLSLGNERVTWTFKWSKDHVRGEMVIYMNKSGWSRFDTYIKSDKILKREFKVDCKFHDKAGRRYDGDRLTRSGTLRRRGHQHKDEVWMWDQVHDHWTDIPPSDLIMECNWKAGRNV
jgi:hypothetical protein